MLLLFLWLIVSLVILGIPCLVFSLLYKIFHTRMLHRCMWWCYRVWGRQLGSLTRYYVPKLSYERAIYPNQPFILISNHYCWMDILILFATAFKERPFVFVMKKSLGYIPLIGALARGLNNPLVDRGRAGRKNKAVLMGAAKEAGEHCYGIALFPEGTRFVKSTKQHRDYQHLLPPKWMGLKCMAKQLGVEVLVLDMTIVYEKKSPSLWDFLWGTVGRVQVGMRAVNVPTQDIKLWLIEAWAKKDQRIDAIQSQYSNIG